VAYNLGVGSIQPTELVLVVIRFNATFLLLRPYCDKIYTSFLNEAESLTTYGCGLWSNVYILPYSLNTTTTFYFATEYSDVQMYRVCIRACACHNAFVLYLTLTRIGLSVLLQM